MGETATIIDGNSLAADTREWIARRVEAVRSRGGEVRLDAVLVESGDNAARQYADNQARTCEALGIRYRLHGLAPSAAYDDIAGRVLLLNADDAVTAMMVHLPMPDGVDAYSVQRLIDPGKDVEGVNPANIGNVVYGRSSLAPCTALAALELVRSTGIELRGKRAVVVGAGDVVGKPIAVLLMRREATVVSCNKWTSGIEDMCRSADVLIAAAGVPELVRGDWIRPGAVVIDVGVNRVKSSEGGRKTIGDVAFEEACSVAGWISPVPGGVGPMTVAMLLSNVVEAAERRVGIPNPGVADSGNPKAAS
ncbi:MAG: bifunctional 5,10-methylenetetrahydrofolate dehydrogenase/5,10-methenyltetrahydrofolate cyclohydrolase [Planctomycetota bacterium]